MEIVNQFFTYLKDNLHINWIVVLIVLLSGLLQNTLLNEIRFAKNDKTDGARKTLLVSLIVSAIWFYFAESAYSKEVIGQYFISFFAATSLYEIVLKKWFDKLLKKFNAEDNALPKPSAPKDADIVNNG